jgi:hypothetical protein
MTTQFPNMQLAQRLRSLPKLRKQQQWKEPAT